MPELERVCGRCGMPMLPHERGGGTTTGCSRCPPGVELWTVADIARELQVSRQAVHQWRAGQLDKWLGAFPEPVATFGARGGVWDPEKVRAWNHRRVSLPHALKGAAKGRYRQTRSIARVAREIGRDPKTVRRWLIELGEYPPLP